MIYVRILADFLFYFFALFLVSSTFSIAVSQISLGISVLLFLTIQIIKKDFSFYKENRLFYFVIFLFIVWLIISSIAGSTPLKSLTALKDEWLFLIIPIGVYLTLKTKIRQNLLTAFAIIISIVSMYGFIQFFTGVSLFSNDEAVVAPIFGYRISGFFSYGITFGNYFSVAGLFLTTYALFGFKALSKNNFRLYFGSGISALCMAILTFSRAPILAIVLVVVFVIILLGKKRWKQGLAFILALLVVLALLPGIKERFVNEFDKEYSGEHKAGRVYIWNNSFKMISDHPIIGVGIGNFKESYTSYIPFDVEEIRKVSSAHNDFLDISANTGIPGFILYTILWITALRAFWNRYKTLSDVHVEQKAILLAVICGSICFVIISMFHGVFVDDEVRQLLMFLWSLGFSIIIQSNLDLKTINI